MSPRIGTSRARSVTDLTRLGTALGPSFDIPALSEKHPSARDLRPPRLRDIDGVAYEIAIVPARVRMFTAAGELATARVVTGRSCRPSN
jgi:hypothetical protein